MWVVSLIATYVLTLLLCMFQSSYSYSTVRTRRQWTNAQIYSAKEIKVIVDGCEQLVNVNEGQSILLAVEAAKIEQKSFCRTGTCGSCAMRIRNLEKIGSIIHDEPEPGDMIARSKVKKGYILSCIALVAEPGAIIELNKEDDYERA